jgi:hypothetical protein
MILRPSDLKKMVSEWLAAGYTVDLDLETGKVKIQPTAKPDTRDPFDLVDMSK